MCVCNPNIRTPFCGKGDCVPEKHGFGRMNDHNPFTEEKFHISLDDRRDVCYYIDSLFNNGNEKKNFEIIISVKEIDELY